jgi:hypothetical protein
LCFFCLKISNPPWQRGVVVIVSANRAEYRGFESRKGVGFLKLIHCTAVLSNLVRIVIICI